MVAGYARAVQERYPLPDPVADVKGARQRVDFNLLETAAVLDSMSILPKDSSLVGFGVALEPSDEQTVVNLTGSIDAYNSPRLAQDLEQLIECGQAAIVVDLQHLQFIDSSGLGALVRGAKLARAAGGYLVLRAPKPAVRKVLHITGLDRIFEIVA
jgi:anti-sigma B factor antagonist